MRLIIATLGTLGDHLPMVGLGSALQQRGLPVRLACNPAMHALVRRAGLEPLAFGEPLGQEQAAESPLAWDQWLAPPGILQWSDQQAATIRAETDALLDLLQPGDVLIGSRNLQFLSLIARVRRCRWVQVGLNSGSMIDDGRMGTRLALDHPWKQGLDRLERALRQQLLGDAAERPDSPPLLRLHAVPEAFVPSDYPQMPCVRTGFWCWDDPRWQGWTPPAQLAALLAETPAPLALAFSSQPLVDPSTLLSRHLEVAERLGRALILVKGWAFRDDGLLAGGIGNHPALVALDALPFSWLLPRVDTVFIHGGMGTLAQALRAGCRVVIEPFGNDQFLNARLALEQQLALVVHPHRLEPSQVSEALSRQRWPAPRLEAAAFTGLTRAAELLHQSLERSEGAFGES